MDLSQISAFDVARLAAAAAFGWGLVSCLWHSIAAAVAANVAARFHQSGHTVRVTVEKDNDTPPGPASA